MRKFEEMKQLIAELERANYTVPTELDFNAAIADMLHFVGDTDSDLREGIYKAFDTLNDNGAFSPDQMRHILTTTLDDRHLFLGIGESGTDTVFMRAFSSLIICVAFCMHDENPFLTSAEIQHVRGTVLRYISQEKDYCGYVPGKGWAHAIAHAADALANIAGVDKATDIDGDYSIGREGLLEILDAIKMLAINPALVYDAEEDERLAEAAMYVIYTEVLSNDDMCSWIADFAKYIDRNTMPSDYFRKINQKHFLRSLYFELIADDDLKELSKFLFDIMTKKEN